MDAGNMPGMFMLWKLHESETIRQYKTDQSMGLGYHIDYVVIILACI